MNNSEIQSVGTRPLQEGARGITATLMNRVFSPSAQGDLLKFPMLAYSEKSGRWTLAELITEYGRPSIVSAIQMAIMDLAVFVGGCPEPQTIATVAGQCAGILASDYYGYKPAEISLFCARFKRGDYGECLKFTGSAIMAAWKKFVSERNYERYQVYRRQQSEEARALLDSCEVCTDPDEIDRILGRTANGMRP